MRTGLWMKIGLVAAILAQPVAMQPESAQAQAVKVQPKEAQSLSSAAATAPEQHEEAAASGERERYEQQTDEFMKTAMDKYHVPGVTLVVVKDGAVWLEKGYGYADVEAKVPRSAQDPLQYRFGLQGFYGYSSHAAGGAGEAGLGGGCEPVFAGFPASGQLVQNSANHETFADQYRGIRQCRTARRGLVEHGAGAAGSAGADSAKAAAAAGEGTGRCGAV